MVTLKGMPLPVIADGKVLELALAACNLTLSAYVLTDSLATSFYPTLVPGHNILIGFLLAGIISADQVGYQGWLPALLMNNTHCFTQKVCGYCAIIPDSLRFTVYHGDYMKLLEKYGVTKGFGSKDAEVWVVMLDDPYCPFCARLELASGDWIKTMINDKKIFFTVVEVAWHKNLPGYNESVNLAYELQKYVDEGKMNEFFNLRMKIVQQLNKLVRGNVTLSNVKSVPKGWVDEQTKIAKALFPVQATPVLVFVNKESGKAIAVIGALPTQVLQWAYEVALKLK